MPDGVIYLTEYDVKRLKELLVARSSGERDDCYLKSLEKELERGRLVAPQNVPGDVITMNSSACLVDLDTGEEMTYTLVFPSEAAINEGKISILAPIGTAMLGCKVGDEFAWNVPAGVRRLKVKEILYQPEASGDYDL